MFQCGKSDDDATGVAALDDDATDIAVASAVDVAATVLRFFESWG